MSTVNKALICILVLLLSILAGLIIGGALTVAHAARPTPPLSPLLPDAGGGNVAAVVLGEPEAGTSTDWGVVAALCVLGGLAAAWLNGWFEKREEK